MTLAPGVRLGSYEILAKVGEGGMGEVYRGRDTKLRREVAIKVLPESLAHDPGRLARFEREAKVLASLNHPNIAQIYGLEEGSGAPALVMELVEGPTLSERMAGMTAPPLEHLPNGARVIPLDETLAIARQIAEALEEAHDKGIIHRDLKPENVKVGTQGRVKVLDFGLAKALGSAGEEMTQAATQTLEGTQQGVVMGTAAYMSPEQAQGAAVDRRADIWSFGVILYELLTGERLFRADSFMETLSAVLNREIDFGRVPASVSYGVRHLLRRCLERDPHRRLRDIGEARVALEDVASGELDEGIALETRGPLSPRGAMAKSSVKLVVELAVVAALVGIALVGWLRRAAPTAPVPIRIHALTYSGSDSDPTASPDGKLVAFTSRRDGTARIWIKQLAGGGEAPLTSGPDGLARFSPDGSSLLFVRDLGTTEAIYRIGLIGGEARRLVDNATEADWSPDGRRIVFVRSRAKGRAVAQLGIFDLATGREKVLADLTNLGNLILRSPRWSPDGRTIAFASGTFSSADWKLQIVDVTSGRVAEIPRGKPESAMGGVAWSGNGKSLFYVQSPGIMGDITGSGSRVIRCDVASGERRTLFWRQGLSWLNSTVSKMSQLDILAPGRLLLSQRRRSQNLREVDLATPTAASAFRPLATGSAIDRQPVYSGDGRKILFSSNRGGNLDLWMIDRKTHVLRRITEDPADDWDPAFMPDGRHILWSSSRGSGHLEVWLANIDGSDGRQVSNDGVSAQNPEATADGKWVVYWSGNPAKLGVWKVHPDGSGATLLARAVDPALSGVSPDGRYTYWIDMDRLNLRNTLRFVQINSGRVLPFKIEVAYTLGAPAITWGRARWSPDGHAIYFVGENPQGLSGIYEQRFDPEHDTTATRRPVAGFSPELVTESFGVSPDGAHLALSMGQESEALLVAEGVPGALPELRRTP